MYDVEDFIWPEIQAKLPPDKQQEADAKYKKAMADLNTANDAFVKIAPTWISTHNGDRPEALTSAINAIEDLVTVVREYGRIGVPIASPVRVTLSDDAEIKFADVQKHRRNLYKEWGCPRCHGI